MILITPIHLLSFVTWQLVRCIVLISCDLEEFSRAEVAESVLYIAPGAPRAVPCVCSYSDEEGEDDIHLLRICSRDHNCIENYPNYCSLILILYPLFAYVLVIPSFSLTLHHGENPSSSLLRLTISQYGSQSSKILPFLSVALP